MIGHDLLVYAGTVAIFLIGFIATVLLFLAVFGVVVLAVGIVRAFQGRRVGFMFRRRSKTRVCCVTNH